MRTRHRCASKLQIFAASCCVSRHVLLATTTLDGIPLTAHVGPARRRRRCRRRPNGTARRRRLEIPTTPRLLSPPFPPNSFQISAVFSSPCYCRAHRQCGWKRKWHKSVVGRCGTRDELGASSSNLCRPLLPKPRSFHHHQPAYYVNMGPRKHLRPFLFPNTVPKAPIGPKFCPPFPIFRSRGPTSHLKPRFLSPNTYYTLQHTRINRKNGRKRRK